MTQALRLVAIAIALAAVADPVIAVRRSTALPVAVQVPSPSDPSHARAVALSAQITGALGDDAAVNGGEAPLARVLVGDATPDGRNNVPTFAIRLSDSEPRVRFTEVASVRGFEGQRPLIRATARAVGLRGSTTEFSTGTAGEVRKHTWTADDESIPIELPVTPLGDVAQLSASARRLPSGEKLKPPITPIGSAGSFTSRCEGSASTCNLLMLSSLVT